MQSKPASLEPSDTGARVIILAQVVLTVAGMVGFYFYQGRAAAEAALFGGCMAMFNVWLAGRRVRRAAQVARVEPGAEVRVLYLGAVLRFILTLGLFIAGMALLKLPPLPLILTFALAQLGYLFRPYGLSAMIYAPGRDNEDQQDQSK